MAGPSSNRIKGKEATGSSSSARRREPSPQRSSAPRSSHSSSNKRSSPQSVPRYDGNRDPDGISFTGPSGGERDPNSDRREVLHRDIDLGVTPLASANMVRDPTSSK